MTGIEKITEKILSEAGVKASEIVMQAEKEAHAAIGERIEKANAEAEAIRAEGNEKAANAEEKAIIAAKMEAKRLVALQKNELIEQAFSKALSDMLAYPPEKYSALLLKLTMSVCKDGKGGELLLCAKDKEQYGAELAKKASAESGASVTLSEKCADIKGGVIVARENIEFNCSLEAIIRSLREELAHPVSDALFGKGE